jgi:hypothetical protein
MKGIAGLASKDALPSAEAPALPPETARLDPEDMRGVIAAYQKCSATLILGNGGFVAKYWVMAR